MSRLVLILILLVTKSVLCQDAFLNEDGTLSNEYHRQAMVEIFNKNSNEVRFAIDDKFLEVISKQDCGDEEYEVDEMQMKALQSSFMQLLNQITAFQQIGFDVLSDIEFEGIIFKTNTICMYATRRYHFKFDVAELKSFPEYMDIQELIEYVVEENDNRNIVFVKNPGN